MTLAIVVYFMYNMCDNYTDILYPIIMIAFIFMAHTDNNLPPLLLKARHLVRD